MLLRFLGLQQVANALSATLTPQALPSPSGPFSNLPVEVIQQIVSFLPLSGAAAFALCNHELAQILGSQYWTHLNLRPPRRSLVVVIDWVTVSCRSERQLLLELLDRDVDTYVCCHRCVMLHYVFDAQFLQHIQSATSTSEGSKEILRGIRDMVERGRRVEERRRRDWIRRRWVS
jgi:hypothetical protein